MPDILVVDDDPDSGQAVAGYLAKCGHSVRWAPGGREALAALGEKLPDFIVLDFLMPGMDGLTLLEVIQSYLRWSVLPVAIVTAYPEHPRLRRAADLGVTRVFTKSNLDLAELAECVDLHARRTPPDGPEGDGGHMGL